jgi:hypothetical protein
MRRDSNFITMSDYTDKRAQPWQKWYTPLPEDASIENLILMGNNGNDNVNRNVFLTSSPATLAAKQQIASQHAAETNEAGIEGSAEAKA